MNYKNYLQTKLGSKVTVTEELNYNDPEDKNSVICTIKYLEGGIYRESVTLPVQLSFVTDDINFCMSVIDSFVKTNANTSFYDGLDYVTQFYNTSLNLSNFQPIKNNNWANIVVNGTLITSKNVSEIIKVEIDDEEYETTTRNLTYASSSDNQRIENEFINKTNVILATNKFVCSTINKASPLNTKLRKIRLGGLDINTIFKIKLTYVDSETTEEYRMKLDSATINSTNQALPVLTLSFTE